MALKADIESAVTTIVSAGWNERQGKVVPSTQDVALANGAVKLEAVYLYADLANSTQLAQDFARLTAAKVIRAFLDATCRVLRARGATITSFDGDRVMGIFTGDSKNSDAAKAALQINHVVRKVVKPAVERNLPSITKQGFQVNHAVGVASGPTLIVRGGVRGSNDLVSIGSAPNIAAKLSDIRESGSYSSYITADVFNRLNDETKFGGSEKKLMWESRSKKISDRDVSLYRSSWTWAI